MHSFRKAETDEKDTVVNVDLGPIDGLVQARPNVILKCNGVTCCLRERLTNCALLTMQMTVAVATFQTRPKQHNRDVALCRTIRRGGAPNSLVEAADWQTM